MSRARVAASLLGGIVALAAPLVVHFEGWKLVPYRDPVGIVSDCAGHTATAKMGARNTHAECARKLRTDFEEHWAGIARCAPLDRVSDEEAAAYLSFAYNVGTGAFCASTLVRKLNAGDRPGACAELSRWTRAGDKVLPGLVERRGVERQLCEAGLPPQ